MLIVNKNAPMVLPQGKLFICSTEVNCFNVILNFSTDQQNNSKQLIPTVAESFRATLGSVITVVNSV